MGPLLPKFKILEHTADLKIQAFGRDKKELFLNALYGMQSALRPEIEEPSKERKREIKVESLDLPSLLVDFLSEINYLNETQKEAYFKGKIKKLSDTFLEAEIFGKKVKNFGLVIKGVTFHDLKVEKREDGLWEAIVLFDI